MKSLSRRDILRFAPLAILSVSPFAAAQRSVEILDVTPSDSPAKAAHLSTGASVEAPPQYTYVNDGNQFNWAIDGTHQELWGKIEGFFGNMKGRYDQSYAEHSTDRSIADQVIAAFSVNEAYVLLQDNLRMFVGYHVGSPAIKVFVITPRTSIQILGVALIHNFCPPGGSLINYGGKSNPAQTQKFSECENDPSVTLFTPPSSPWLNDIQNAVEWYMTDYLSQTPIVVPNDRKAFQVKIFLREVPSAKS